MLKKIENSLFFTLQNKWFEFYKNLLYDSPLLYKKIPRSNSAAGSIEGNDWNIIARTRRLNQCSNHNYDSTNIYNSYYTLYYLKVKFLFLKYGRIFHSMLKILTRLLFYF